MSALCFIPVLWPVQGAQWIQDSYPHRYSHRHVAVRGPGVLLPAAAAVAGDVQPFTACFFTGSLYLLLRLFSLEHVPSHRALLVLKPQDRVSAIGSGSHNESENSWMLHLLLMRLLP